MKTLLLGGICTDFSCAKCCKNTSMFLSLGDIDHIVAQGYTQIEFCFKNEDGFFQLKNIDGECFFLKDNHCQIYDVRPTGCRFYPIIFDLDKNKAILDDECPLIDSISEKTIKNFETDLRKFIMKILREK
ncbi:MAG: YkgJ family cysteine cluster protein [Candidatus Heimdallarchaeota archaeon]